MESGVWVQVGCDTSACVEVKRLKLTNAYLLRTTSDPDLVAFIRGDEWERFKAAVKAGVFD